MTKQRAGRWLSLALLWGSAASACVVEPGHGLDDGATATTEAAVVGAGYFSADGHLAHMQGCGGQPDCATDVPMTGNASPLFDQVDKAVRRFMKTQCVGSGVVAINRKGRRVYKRGFGRMSGSSMEDLPAHCQNDSYANSADFVLPDTDVGIGSLSKFVTGSMVRALVQQRIVAAGKQATYPDPTMALLLDPDLELLPPQLLRYLDQTRVDAQCPPIAVTDIAGCSRAGACGSSGPDVRWQSVTIGDLLAHTAALPGSAPSWESTVVNAATLRNLNSAYDFLTKEHLAVRTATPFQTELDSARQYIANTAGVDVNTVYFVSPWNRNDPGGHPIDEVLTMVAGRCLSSDADPAGQSDTNPAGSGDYANTGFVILERVVTHLHPAARFSANDGEVLTQTGSVLDIFLEDEGMKEGVQNEHAMFTRHKMVNDTGGPDRRAWSDTYNTYTWKRASWLRPFCIWSGGSCDFTYWSDGCTSHKNCPTTNDHYRLPPNFATHEWIWDAEAGVITYSPVPPLMPFEQSLPSLAPGTGNIAVEAPAVLKLMNKYYVGVSNDVRLGRLRASCPECNVTAVKGGDAGGTYARAMTLVGGLKSERLPPLTPSGDLTIEPDVGQWVTQAWTDAADVDFVVSIQQDRDEQQGNDGYMLATFLRYALSRVDWAAVDRMVERQRMNVVGIGLNTTGNTYYWYEDEHKTTLTGLPNTHRVEPAAVTNPPQAQSTYTIPSTRIGSDIVGMAISSSNRVYAWYDDGHVSGGNSGELDANLDAYEYTVPGDYAYTDIVGMGITSGDTVVSWFNNGKVSFGNSAQLGSTLFNFTLPPGQTIAEIVGMAVRKANDHTYTVFKDGSVAEGDYYDLDKFSFRPGKVVGMGMKYGNTSIWYLSGYRRDLSGSPADNRLIPSVLPSSGYYRLLDNYSYSDVAGIAHYGFFSAQLWFKDGARAWATIYGDFLDSTGIPGSTIWPSGQDGNTAVGVAISGSGDVYSWYNTTARAKGTASNLMSGGQWPDYDFPAGQQEIFIYGIAIDSGGDGDVWTLFRDGAVAQGRSWELHDEAYWPSPHANSLP